MSAVEDGVGGDIALSVIVPCYNQGEYILDALSSVQNCQDPVYEVIIINDGSTEALTLKVLSYLKEQGYRVVDQENQGLAAARNRGINLAKGRYILPLDADNKIRSDYITKGIEILDKYPEVGVVYGNAELFGEKTGVWEFPDFDVNRILIGNFIDACAVLRKSVWQDCGGYDAKIPQKLGYEDWDLWLGAVEKGWKFYHVPEVLFDYRFREDSMVSRCNIPENRKQLLRYIYAKHIGLFSTNFINVLAEKEFAFLSQNGYGEIVNLEWQKTQAELEVTRSFLAQTKAELEQNKLQLQQGQAQLNQAELEIHNFQAYLQEVQTELGNTQTQLQLSQTSLQQVQGELGETKNHLDLVVNQTEKELAETRSQLQHTQEHLQHTKGELEQAKNIILAMESSKFWKIRTAWVKVRKSLMGVSENG